MSTLLDVTATNTILYCQNWEKTVHFYKHSLNLPITFSNDWFVEFRLSPSAFLSIADESHASIKSSHGAGLTLTIQVGDADEAYRRLITRDLQPQAVRNHPWGARTFYLFDPEGTRLEIWSDTRA
jgi:catechol 2,3-dioxygenase-like lactoylglutathione lyase family enzyme